MFFLPWFDKVGFDNTGLSVTPLTHEPFEELGKLLLECPCDYLVLTD